MVQNAAQRLEPSVHCVDASDMATLGLGLGHKRKRGDSLSCQQPQKVQTTIRFMARFKALFSFTQEGGSASTGA